MKWLDNRLVRYGFILLIVSVIVYDFYYIPNRVRDEQELAAEYLSCPYTDSFEAYWNAWSHEFKTKNPDADTNMQINEWNSQMIANNCGQQWLKPFNDTI